mmetsp:Transcript_47935/g.126935  ORF Transcript_47935/g.126935 Transcript_47935/m.126935 type:complete len:222 (-) Transcript_47935:133-798(-)|eukprot:CAMPEP_0194529296 /NCGR_PEP_ID=MMETSP0253-20130528/65928_1 /TAXON_ID=2966 /ORGANISM="Noctiluca scintillans" /LENGTH=221 /DNA_ID=CAMNT_0039374427 /DNA_START=29 /DNA_END=694 /DNA_ORIENTATION=-
MESTRTAEQTLSDYNLWPGWASQYNGTQMPIGPGKFLDIPREEEPDTEVVGFAYPLAHVEYALRNERKHPPPTEEDMFQEMHKLINNSLDAKLLKPSYVMCVIYNHINRNRRDSEGWQHGLIRSGGVEKLVRHATGGDARERYWVMAIFGRMLGTSEVSRRYLLDGGVVEHILTGTRDQDEEVRECAICALKGLIQYPEGRAVVSYDKLIECLSSARQRRT